MTKHKWLTSEEVADYLNVSVATVHRWRMVGMGPPWHKPPGTGTVRYNAQEIDDWMRSGNDEKGGT